MIGRWLAAAVAAVVVLYGRAWRFDLHCDDLIVIRPWSASELAAVWHGTWEPQHAWAVFFRPLAAWFYAGSFELFGVRAEAHLALSLTLLVLVAFALAVFVGREAVATHGATAAGNIGVAAAMLYALHPNTPWATGTWITNDFHKLAALAALGALLLWQRRHDGAPTAWWPIALAALVAFLVKEDQIVLLPTLVALTWLRGRWFGAPTPHLRAIAGLAVAVAAAAWAWRLSALGQLGGFALPSSAEVVARNLARGPLYVFGAIGNPIDHVAAGDIAAATLVIAVSLAVILRLPRPQQWPAVCGLVLMGAYGAPLAFVSGATRYYMLTLGATIVLATVVHGLWSLTPRGVARAALATLLAFIAIVAAGRQQAALAAFAPCSPLDLDCRSFVLDAMPLLPPEARSDIASLPESCRAGIHRRLDQTPVLTWGLGATVVDTMAGTLARSAGSHVVTLFDLTATSAEIRVRHSAASPAAPVSLVITIDGNAEAPLTLTDTEWTTKTVTMGRGWRARLRGAHRADVVVRGGAADNGLEWQPIVVRR